MNNVSDLLNNISFTNSLYMKWVNVTAALIRRQAIIGTSAGLLLIRNGTNDSLIAVFLMPSKAFDTLNLDTLFYNLKYYRITGIPVYWSAERKLRWYIL